MNFLRKYYTKTLDKQLKTLKEKYDQLNLITNDADKNAPFAFDFEKMNAVSVERFPADGDDIAYTIIGYNSSKDSIELHDWNVYCSLEVHNKIVEEFRQYMDKK